MAASRSSRLRARSSASAWLRQTIRRSPGNSGAVMAAMSRSSNSDICKAPPSRSAWIAGARKAVIQSSPAGLRSSPMRAWVIMPRSPTRTTWSRPKRSLSLSTWLVRVVGIGGVAGEHLDRHRTAVGGAQQAIDDLPLAALAVPAVAELGERTAAPFQIAGRDVVEHQRAAAEMALGQRRLDRWLAHRQPVERAVELVLVDHAQAELLAQARGRGVAATARGRRPAWSRAR